jgi:hypothetical protein
VEAGAKTCTVRLSARAAGSIQSGDPLALCFGRYQSPTVVLATAARVEHFDLTDDLAARYGQEAEADALTDEEIAERQPEIEALDDLTPAQWREMLEAEGVGLALLDALEASSMNARGYDDVLDEAEDRQVSAVHLIWWSLS